MRHLPVLGLLAIIGALGVSSASCSDEVKLRALCKSDQQCIDEHGGNPYWACDKNLGDCVCKADAACVGEEEYCELYPGGDGRCHPRVRCDTNEDCEGRTFCDTVNHHCRLTGCSSDLQCDLGEICDPLSLTCVEGCRGHGDCVLGEVCMCDDGTGNLAPCPACDEEDPNDCPVGQCVAGTCAGDEFCRFKERCLPGSDGELPSCELDTRGPYCDACTIEPGKPFSRCGSEGPNFCLIDTSDAARRSTFCGVDCSQGQPCPNGFACHDVLVLTEEQCVRNEDCLPRPHARSCSDDDDCPAGARCVAGKCAGSCRIAEGANSGFCGCVEDADCPQQTCIEGRCSITREPCVPGEQDTCMGSIRCINNGQIGYCKIGRNCAPADGLTCADVRADHP